MPCIRDYRLDCYRIDGIAKGIQQQYAPSIRIRKTMFGLPEVPIVGTSKIEEAIQTETIGITALPLPTDPGETAT